MQPNLDLLRAVAVLLVLLSHVHSVVTGKQTNLMYNFGQLGVALFFVHTSLVLMQSLERQRLTGPTMFKRFYAQRIFRIYPLSIIFVLCIIAFGQEQWSRLEIVSNLALTQNLTYSRYVSDPLWSLPLEVQMYIALPFLFVAFRDKPVSWLLALWLLAIPVGWAANQITLRLSVLYLVPCFLGGVIAWRLQGNEKLPAWIWPPLLALYCLGFALWAEPRQNHYGRWSVCLALGLTIPWLRQLAAPTLNAASKTIAKYSYGIYLFHFPLLDFAFRTLADRPYAVQWAVFLLLVVLIPVAAYHLIEHPMIRLGHAWTERKTVRGSYESSRAASSSAVE
jgi:peptidoglycan/LPS O-acetylase OafA/YrhL